MKYTFLFFLTIAFFSSAIPLQSHAKTKTKETQINLNLGKIALEDRVYDVALRYFVAYRDENIYNKDCFLDATILIVKTAILADKLEIAAKALKKFTPWEEKLTKNDKYYSEFITAKTQYLIVTNQLKEAKKLLEKSLPNFINDIDAKQAKLLLGAVKIQLAEYDEAQELFTSLSNSSDVKFKSESLLGLIKIQLAKENLEEAEKLLAQYDELKIDAQTSQIYRTIFLIKRGLLDEALASYKEAENYQPLQGNYNLWNVSVLLSDALIKAERYTDSLVILEKSHIFAVTEKNKLLANIQLTETLAQVGNIKRASALLKQVRDKYPNYKEIYNTDFFLATCAYKNKEYNIAKTHYNHVVSNINAKNKLRYQAQFNIGNCLHEEKNYKDAAENFIKSHEIAITDQQKAESLFAAADNFNQEKDYNYCITIYKTIIDSFAELEIAENAIRTLGRVYFEKKDYENSCNTYKSYCKKYPKGKYIESVTINYGLALRCNEKAKEALTTFSSFLVSFPNSAETARVLEEAYKTAFLLNNISDAEKFISIIIKDHQDSSYYPKALYWQNYILFLNQSPDAIKSANKYITEVYNKGACSIEEVSDVRFWLADMYLNEGNFSNARKIYLNIWEENPNNINSAKALFEAARCSLFLEEPEQGITILNDLKNTDFYKKQRKFYKDGEHFDYSINLLIADLETNLKQYPKAIETLQKTIKTIENNDKMYWIICGRLAEIQIAAGLHEKTITSGKEVNKFFNEAIANINKCLIDKDKIPSNILELLLFNKGVALEQLEELTEAFATYYSIVGSYSESLVRKDNKRDWKILEEAAFKAAEISIRCNDFEKARRIYRRISRMNLPLSQEAIIRANNIQKLIDNAHKK